MESYRLEVFVTVPWGDGPGAIPMSLQDYPSFAEMSPDQVRRVRVPVRIRVDAHGGVHVLPSSTPGRPPGFIDHVDANGRMTARTPLDRAAASGGDSWTIRDYVVDGEGNSYVLEHLGPREARNRLQKLSATGMVLWSREGPTNDDAFDVSELKGNFQRLWMDEDSRLYLPAIEHAGVIAELDSKTGAVSELYTSARFSRSGFLSAACRMVYVLYFQDSGRRGIGVFDMAHQRLTTLAVGTEESGWLVFPFGADGESNVYAWRDSAIARIAPDGRVTVLGALDNLTVGADGGTVYSSVLRRERGESAVQVTSHDRVGQISHRELSLRGTKGWSSAGEWKLIHVDERERYYVFGGEEPGEAGTLLIYSDRGVLLETISPPPDLLPLESTLERPTYWDVDRRGRIYMPVMDSDGFKVIRFTDAGMLAKAHV